MHWFEMLFPFKSLRCLLLLLVVHQKEGKRQGSRGEEDDIPKPMFLRGRMCLTELAFRYLIITVLSLPIQPLFPAMSSSSLSCGQLIIFTGVNVETVVWCLTIMTRDFHVLENVRVCVRTKDDIIYNLH